MGSPFRSTGLDAPRERVNERFTWALELVTQAALIVVAGCAWRVVNIQEEQQNMVLDGVKTMKLPYLIAVTGNTCKVNCDKMFDRSREVVTVKP